jgi:hypothetical protein
LFASPGQREAFVEAIWTFRRVVPLPNVAYAEPIDVFVGTWNLGDAMPASNIDAWLHPREFDLYVVSAQEAGYDLEKGQTGSAEAHFFGLLQSRFYFFVWILFMFFLKKICFCFLQFGS